MCSSAFGNVVPQNLWDAFEEFATEALLNVPEARTITQIMAPWTEQAGYPVLRVTLRDRDAVITQVNYYQKNQFEDKIFKRLILINGNYFRLTFYLFFT